MTENSQTSADLWRDRVLARIFPEMGAGGYTALDGTVEFYGRVQALLGPGMTVLDYGAGRGAGLEDACDFRRQLRTLKGKAAKVIACDVSDAVLYNPGADERVLIEADGRLPFDDSSIDLIVSDFVFEHISDPAHVSRELWRILKPGGWVCARTPNRFGFIPLLTRCIPNSLHHKFLSFAQPGRSESDVFPTVFRINSKLALERWFPLAIFEHYCYRYEAEPSYFFGKRWLLMTLLIVNRILPPVMKTTWFVFLRKR